MSLAKDKEARLIEINKKNKVEEPAPVPVEVQTAEPESTEPQSKAVPQVEVKEQPKIEEPTKPEVVEEPKSWDADETKPTEKVEHPKFDFSKIGSALELGEIKDETEFVAKVSEIKSKLKEVQEKPLSWIPDDFKEVIEVAKTGVDWKDYLSNQLIDYTKIDPIQLFEDDFINKASKNPKYFTDGKFDEEKALTALDAIQEPVREYHGRQLADILTANQKHRQQEMKVKAETRITQAGKSLSQATKNLNEILPFENYGIKFEPKHSSETYQGITDSTLTRKYLGVDYETLVRSGADMKEIAATIAMRHYGEKMLKFKSQTAKAEGKKELLNTLQNPQINTPGTALDPTPLKDKEPSLPEKMRNHFASTQKGL